MYSVSGYESVDIDRAQSFLKHVKEHIDLDTYQKFIDSVICCSQLPESERNPMINVLGHPDLIKILRCFYNNRIRSKRFESVVGNRETLEKRLPEYAWKIYVL